MTPAKCTAPYPRSLGLLNPTSPLATGPFLPLMMKEERPPYISSSFLVLVRPLPFGMTTLPIASFCSADAAPSKTSQSYSEEQPETGELSLCLQHYKLHHGLFQRK